MLNRNLHIFLFSIILGLLKTFDKSTKKKKTFWEPKNKLIYLLSLVHKSQSCSTISNKCFEIGNTVCLKFKIMFQTIFLGSESVSKI